LFGLDLVLKNVFIIFGCKALFLSFLAILPIYVSINKQTKHHTHTTWIWGVTAPLFSNFIGQNADNTG